MTTPEAFRELTSQIAGFRREDEVKPTYLLAELNDLLTAAAGDQFSLLICELILDPYYANYVAAMVELAAHMKGVRAPGWTASIKPLDEPVFYVPWMSLRAHLLLNSPIPFRRRNIFIDSSIGARV